MRSNIGLWWLLTGFFGLVFLVYVGWTLLFHLEELQAGEISWIHAIDWTGATALLFSTFMAAMIGFFTWRWHASQKGIDLPEDRLDADIDDGDPEVGEYSPWSWWPLLLAAAAALGALALAVGPFLFPFAIGLLLVSLVGWTYEYYRGNFAR